MRLVTELQQKSSKIVEDYEKAMTHPGGSLALIPPEFRKSDVIVRFCYYLTRGMANSWKECLFSYNSDDLKEAIEAEAYEISECLAMIKSRAGALAFE